MSLIRVAVIDDDTDVVLNILEFDGESETDTPGEFIARIHQMTDDERPPWLKGKTLRHQVVPKTKSTCGPGWIQISGTNFDEPPPPPEELEE